ncbi:alpha-L-fucosidase [Terrimicrobium sacchariphilum]|uniref:alpha-L-fucosidase n=1 Tax=Terrimicrobium sacchariphilum TaxID=690879 RepID=A0A146GDK8_TERSA|nr:alpha-L-fucosidase [Terrimicrobium sacchariphilum]GAT34586.1 alpha-L-fucosidase [Terrimicrobium sacchariphilum]
MTFQPTHGLILACLLGVASRGGATSPIPSDLTPAIIVDTSKERVAEGKFQPSWESLHQYEIPGWFRDAKFGIWAHWGPQCQPEAGDWYGRNMYMEGNGQYSSHLNLYGHPSKSGFKDVIHEWKAEHWNPSDLVARFQRAGAQYVMTMANHHDNLDLWDSQYQPWNSVKVGPRQDIIAGWAAAARKAGIPFGVSVHAAHAWTWYESAQGADTKGPLAGIPYDGNLTKDDGKGLWWDGLDPQDLYAQNHPPSTSSGYKEGQWDWGGGVTPPDQAYCDKFYNRTMDLINRVQPDLIYFDDTALPLWPVSDAGLKIAAHYYNQNMKAHNGRLTAVMFGKVLTEDQKGAMVLDIERGAARDIQPLAWQSDTCLGDWHYNRSYFNGGMYRSATNVIRMLVDIVSKNGNLLLSVPVRGDGTIDEKEQAILDKVGQWMDVNKESIIGTRPWSVFAEEIVSDSPDEKAKSDGNLTGYRFATKGNTLYVTVFGATESIMKISALGSQSSHLDQAITAVEQLGHGPVRWQQTSAHLEITPSLPVASDAATVFKVTLRSAVSL